MNLKKIILFLIATSFICLLLPTANAQSGRSYLQRILSRGVLRVGVYSKDYPPFFMHDKSGKLIGADIALAKHIAKTLGVKIQFFNKYPTYNAVVTAVAHNRIDVGISQLTITLNRAKHVLFTQPYTVMRQGLIINRKELEHFKYSGLLVKAVNSPQVKLGVVADSAYVRLAKENFPRARVMTFKDWSGVMRAVMAGTVLAGYFDEGGIKEYLLLRPQARTLTKIEYLHHGIDRRAIVVAWNHPQLYYWLNLYLSDTHTDLMVDTAFRAYADYFKAMR